MTVRALASILLLILLSGCAALGPCTLQFKALDDDIPAAEVIAFCHV